MIGFHYKTLKLFPGKTMQITRNNHYVPIWYQKRFLSAGKSFLHYLDFCPEEKELIDGRIVTMNRHYWLPPQKCFCVEDLYTTSFLGFHNDEIERFLFGAIDTKGALALRALVEEDMPNLYRHYMKFFEYIDAQKLRTPKGLDWIKTKYPQLSQLELMYEMQSLRQMHSTMWLEAVREIVSAEESEVKFLISDHPVTIYNSLCSPASSHCEYPNDPSITLNGSQTIFPLDLNHCLIFTNLEYAKDPENTDLMTNRTNARHFGQTLSRFDTMIRKRKLREDDVKAINYILKARARRFIAAGVKEWLYPELTIKQPWNQIGKTLFPPVNELHRFGGEIYVGYEDGSTSYQDAFGRTIGDIPYLKKKRPKSKIGRNDPCLCGSGKKYKKCCECVPQEDRPLTTEYSIRERNIMFFNAVTNILGHRKTWEDVRRELSDKQVVDIHGCYGSLWPKDTNLIDFLPKPDTRVLRALYTGLIDPRVILTNVVHLSLYYDEIILVSPFTNPACVKEKFSPTHSPTQYKEDTIKNTLLLLQLFPFIAANIVNMIPDPSDFNPAFKRTVYNMAKYRTKKWKPDTIGMSDIELFCKEDYLRMIMSFSDDIIRRDISLSSPGLSKDEVEATLDYIKKQQIADPLALLQDKMPGERHGQLNKISLSPNLELALFIAQNTGSFIYTDNEYRWAEILWSVIDGGNELKPSKWEPLMQCFNNLKFIFFSKIDPLEILRIRGTEKFVNFRNVLRKTINHIQKDDNPSESLIKSITDNLMEAHTKLQLECESIERKLNTREEVPVELECFSFYRSFDCRIPLKGFGLNTVQRLLVAYGGHKYSASVPMAMFIEKLKRGN